MGFRLSLMPVAGLIALLCAAAVPAQKAGPPSAVGKGGKAVGKTLKVTVPPPKAAPKKPADAPVTITLRANAEVINTTFTLGEVADLSGGDQELLDKLAGIQIGASPLPGLSRALSGGDVVVKLRANKLESPRIQIVAPPGIRVSRAASSVAADEVTKAAMVAAQSALQDFPEATLEPVPTFEKITLPKGNVLLMAGAVRGKPETGTLYVPISLMVDGKPARTVEVSLRVRRKTKALIALRAIEPREVLSEADVEIATIELPLGFTQPIVDLREAIGKRAKRRLAANAPIPANALEAPPALSANAKVTIEYVYGTIYVSAPGVTRQGGAIGDTIRVYALDTKKELDAVIINSRTVRIGGDEPNAPSDEAANETEEE